MSDVKLREEICTIAQSLYSRGLTAGSSGNLSVRTADGFLMTPTGSTMGALDPARLSVLDVKGAHIGGDKPTKEAFLHMAMYSQRPKAQAVVHLHSTYCVAVSCLADVNPQYVLPPLTAYYVMRIGTLPMVPYFPPGDVALAKAVEETAAHHHAMLLANHGPVVAGTSLTDAVYASEELEETAKLFLLLRGMKSNPLSSDEVAALNARFPKEV